MDAVDRYLTDDGAALVTVRWAVGDQIGDRIRLDDLLAAEAKLLARCLFGRGRRSERPVSTIDFLLVSHSKSFGQHQSFFPSSVSLVWSFTRINRSLSSLTRVR